ncbi:MAG: sigma-70 family RNA polymerase sigma factor [Chitinophagaceae bacterium]
MHQTADDILITHWDDFLKGNAPAFSKIMQGCYPDLFRYGSRFTTDDELVKDCIQNIFLTLWKNRSTVSHTGFVRFYLLKALRREIHKQLRHEKRIGDVEELSNSLFDIGLNPELRIVDHEISGELSQKIRRILEGLPRRQQEIIYLRFYANADADEIARIMNISRQSVYNLLHEALKKLKTYAENFLISVLLCLSLSIFF